MRPHWRLGIWLVTATITVAGVGVLHAEQPAIQCGPPRIEASFTAALSSYHVTTSCSAVPAGFVVGFSRFLRFTHGTGERRCMSICLKDSPQRLPPP